MKRYSKKIAIILTLVMILTSFGFTGAFAVDENGAGETGDQAVQVTEPEEEVAALETVIKQCEQWADVSPDEYEYYDNSDSEPKVYNMEPAYRMAADSEVKE